MNSLGDDSPFNPFFFVIARDTGNVLRVIHRDSRPPNTPTLIHRSASTAQRTLYIDAYQTGRDIIHASQVLEGFSNSDLHA